MGLSHLRSQGRGPRPRSNGSKTGPLRKIVGRTAVGYATLEALECGHLQMPKHDIIGETNAVRRRCRYCKKQWPVHFAGTEPPDRMSADDYHRVNQECETPNPE